MKTRLAPLLVKRAALSLLLLTFTTFDVAQLSTVHAQGTAFTYQGRLNDGASAANGIYDLRFTIYDLATNGTLIAGPVTNSATGVSNGLFTVMLDFGATPFTGADRWLDIAVRTNGGGAFTTLNPRQKLSPTPYAVFAEGANAGGITGSIPAGSLSGTYPGTVTFNNSANVLAGNGAGLTSLNASQLTSGTVPVAVLGNAWQTGGNAGTTVGADYLGTSDNQPLELRVHGGRALRLEPTATNGAVNVIGGSPNNFVAGNVVGATIAGGGAVSYGNSSPSNTVRGDFGTVSGGDGNLVAGFEATISGGGANTISNDDATIGGGFFNAAGGYSATIGGGFENVASGDTATVGGGLGNNSTAQYATVSGGSGNHATGLAATVPGGNLNNATGSDSFAAGNQAFAGHSGAFVWADSQNAAYFSDRNDQFKVRAGGGVVMDVSGSSGLNPAALRVNSTSTSGVGIFVAQSSSDATAVFTAAGTGDIVKGFSGSGGGNLVFEVLNDGTVKSKGVVLTSDRNAKANFAHVNPESVLAKVAALPLTEWNYRDDPADTRHIGPMAQDFQAAFGLNGTDDKHISVVDEGGVALAAIQGLNEKLEVKSQKSESQMAELKAENEELKARLEKLELLIKLQKGDQK